MSVFSGTLPAVSNAAQLHARSAEFRTLASLLEFPRNSLVSGLCGVGKGSLLRSFFSWEYRANALLEQGRLYHLSEDFPKALSSGSPLDWFFDRACAAIRDIPRMAAWRERADDAEGAKTLRALQGRLTAAADALPAGETSRLGSLLDAMADEGVCLTLVIQHFQTFTLSQQVTQEHLDLLRAWAVAGKICFLVATDYTFDRLAATQLTGGSSFIHTFTGNDLPLTGWSEADTCAYLANTLGGEEGKRFASLYGSAVYQASGGIPPLVRYAADAFLTESPDDQNTFLDELYTSRMELAAHYFRGWCRQLSYDQKQVLAALAGTARLSQLLALRDEHPDTVKGLLRRGLLRKQMVQHEGMSIEYCTLNCGWFRAYLQQNDLLTESQCHAEQDLRVLGERLKDVPVPAREDLRSIVESSPAAAEPAAQDYCTFLDSYQADPRHIPASLARRHRTPQGLFAQCSQPVRDLLFYALLTEQTLMPIILEAERRDNGFEFEASPCSIEYFKATELLLRETLLPLFTRYLPDECKQAFQDGKGKPDEVSIGFCLYILWEFRVRRQLADAALERGFPEFDAKWWSSLYEILNTLRDIRNPVAHAELTYRDKLDLCTASLLGENGLLARCLALQGWARTVSGAADQAAH